MLYAPRRHVNYSYVKMATDIYIIRDGQLAHQFNEPNIFLLNSEFTHTPHRCVPHRNEANLTCVIIKAAYNKKKNNLKPQLYKCVSVHA